MKRLKQAAITFESILLMQMPVFADAQRADKQLLKAILEFLHSCSFFLFAVGIGMIILSAKTDNAEARANAVKIVGAGVLLFALNKIAAVAGLI